MAPSAHVGYVRVSSSTQSPERQLLSIPLDKKFIDYASGKDTNRPGLIACLDYLREGDTLHVHSIDRLARNSADCHQLVKDLTDNGITVVFHNEGITFKPGEPIDANKLLLFNTVAMYAQYEREVNIERQRDGRLAKALNF